MLYQEVYKKTKPGLRCLAARGFTQVSRRKDKK